MYKNTRCHFKRFVRKFEAQNTSEVMDTTYPGTWSIGCACHTKLRHDLHYSPKLRSSRYMIYRRYIVSGAVLTGWLASSWVPESLSPYEENLIRNCLENVKKQFKLFPLKITNNNLSPCHHSHGFVFMSHQQGRVIKSENLHLCMNGV